MALTLVVLGLVSRFAFFGHPQEVVFDETHFGKFMNGYVTGSYFFDIHPPLAKLMFAGVARVIGYKADYTFEKIGEKYTSSQYLWFRLLPSLAGAFFPLLIFFLALELGIRPRYAFFAGLLLVFDNALIVQSRFILLDAFLLLFGFTALLAYLRFLKSRSIVLLTCVGLLAISAALIKWTGLSFLGLIGIHYLLQHKNYSFSYFLKGFVFLAIVPVIFYASIFIIHFSLLTKSGSGDAFHTPAFQKTLFNSTYSKDQTITPLPLVQKIIELNKTLYTSQAGMDSTHPTSSKWYEWPIMKKPIFYWVSSDGKDGKIYFFGNPVTWYFGVIAALIVLYEIAKRLYVFFMKQRIRDEYFFDIEKHRNLLFLFGGYCANILPFILIHRLMFLYHYLVALVFSILIFVYLLDKNHSMIKGIPLKPFLVLVIVIFCILAPLTYGLGL